MDGNMDKKPGPMLTLATHIVDKRNLVFLLVGIALIFSFIARDRVSVENDLTAYLPPDSETKEGLDVMKQQFITYGSANIMVANVSYEEAEALFNVIKDIEGVQQADFDDSTEHYNHASALYSVTFDYPEEDPACLDALAAVKAALEPRDTYVSTSLGDTSAELIRKEVNMITAFVAVIVVLVLTFTSQTYAEVPIIGLTFIVAAVLNTGTNFLMGTISFVSNSVSSILQLALSVDYAIILCNRYKEENAGGLSVRDAVIVALSKSIPEILSSSLTTISGLFALVFMQYKIGADMGIVLIKAILLSLLSVFTLMPGLLMLFAALMDRTRHKNFVPKIGAVGKFSYATRHVVPLLFMAVFAAAWWFSKNCPYVYGYSTLSTPVLNETQIADNMITDNFGDVNFVAVVVPGHDYRKEHNLIRDLENRSEVRYCQGLANTEAMGGYMLAEREPHFSSARKSNSHWPFLSASLPAKLHSNSSN